ncbi:MAG: zinc ribbon domain-containing protein [Coriobacteriia bacterium]
MDQGAALLDLQETDLSILRAEKRLDEMPEKRAILETRKKIRDVGQLRGSAEELVGRLQREVARHEDECSTVKEKLESEQAKFMSGEIKNPKELTHISREMDALKRRLDKLEMEEIALMERVEKAKGQVDKVDAALKQLASKETAVIATFKSQGSELTKEIEALKAHRETLTPKIDADLLARYEAIREAKGGIGVGRLEGSKCTACHMELPIERVASLKGGPDVASCPGCRRLIVIIHEES